MRLHAGGIVLSPSDLTSFVECRHATALDLAAVHGGARPPRAAGAFAELLARKGMEHEGAHLARCIAQYGEAGVVDIPSCAPARSDQAAATIAAMQAGVPVVYQAALELPGWNGVADFLERVDVGADDPARRRDGWWGRDWLYEPVDTKLARAETLPHHALQLAWYAEALASIQGARPEQVHVELGSGRRESVRTVEIGAYFRRQRGLLAGFAGEPRPTEAVPCDHCALCGHSATCTSEWRRADHLHYVAGIRRSHIRALRDAGVETLAALAGHDPAEPVAGISPESLAVIVDQARLQRRQREEGGLPWHHIPPLEGAGFDRLPAASQGDLYLDFEGDPVWRPDRELVFLAGLQGPDGYTAIWAHDEAGEAELLRATVAAIHQARAADPGMHVYHYSPAEPSLLRRLAERHTLLEDELYALFAEGVFVDLYPVVTQGLRAGVESYGLKSVERLAGFERAAAMEGGDDAVVAYEDWIAGGCAPDDGRLDAIAAYNAEDCRATAAVAAWLRANPPEGAPQPTDDPAADEPELTDRQLAKQAGRERRAELAARLRDEHEPGTPERLLAELLVYHDRESRAANREYFELLALRPEDRHDDGRVLDGLSEVIAERWFETKKKPWVIQTFTFPEQDHKVGEGGAYDLDADDGERGVTVISLDEKGCQVVVRRPADRADVPLRSLAQHDYFDQTVKEEALERVANAVMAGVPGGQAAAIGLLRGGAPSIPTLGPGELVQVSRPADAGTAKQQAWLDAVLRRVTGLDGGALVVQGPPGTGKTWLGGRIVVALVAAGKSVAVTAVAHKAIETFLAEVESAAAQAGVTLRGERVVGEKGGVVFAGIAEVDAKKSDTWPARMAGPARSLDLGAGTAFALSRPDNDAAVDVLLIDEAGQYSLADAVAAATCARQGVILLGDPLQLPQVTQASHQENAGRSVLEHLLDGAPMIAPDRGILLTVTRRMHPDVCGFISEQIYEGALESLPECALQHTCEGTGIRFVEIEHEGRGARSPEEAAAIAGRIEALLAGSWTRRDGTEAPIGAADVMVVTPYNAQVRTIRSELAHAGPVPAAVEVGTVDKFQGREAPVVLVSMATSSDEDVPRSVDFLFSRNRLNVAVSRAQCLAIVVANPRLLDAKARSIEQMKLISTLCALHEAAGGG